MITMIKRNLKLFFRDKSAVFFSLLSVVIIIGLYIVFLGDAWMSDSIRELNQPENLMNSWLMAGILAVTSVTTTMGAFGVMIDDKTKKINKDFYASPIKSSGILSGYLVSAFLIGVIMSIIMSLIAQAYLAAQGVELLTALEYLSVFLLILLASLMNTSMICFIVSFFKSQNAFSTASTIIGTLIGFLTGIYLPIGALPESVQTLIKLIPASHAAALLRQILMRPSLDASFLGIPAKYAAEFRREMGVTFYFGDFEVTPLLSIAFLLVITAVFYGLSLARMSGKGRRL